MHPIHREVIGELRRELMAYHKSLLEAARLEYEAARGPIANPNDFFRLVLSDEAFAWLKAASDLILAFDELEGMETAAEEDVFAARAEIDRLLSPSQSEFGRRSNELMESSPDAVFALAKLQKLALRLPQREESGEDLFARRQEWRATPRRR